MSSELDGILHILGVLNAVSKRKLSQDDYVEYGAPALRLLRPGAVPDDERNRFFAKAVGKVATWPSGFVLKPHTCS